MFKTSAPTSVGDKGLNKDSAEKVRFQKTEKIFRSQMAYNERSALG
jgi:hypothetical protein